jgi:hypothetical protein
VSRDTVYFAYPVVTLNLALIIAISVSPFVQNEVYGGLLVVHSYQLPRLELTTVLL